ncbi:methylated-DNA--[protein]-cysteine S-methyltransferase [Cryomorpha ignava]|uniref:Methylated-DNA--protein-cysteine methyltransferase n=1 Tax=Cryomorpha ignava TaxID=101383 RepID=A0A7K3WP26_9FLAO|nr:methylated-DNA--[protein]-cysteine S-methyltransferase [Cryomorpha ignava]NEN22612.1 methylated-DNA--[protein]-cysteine S-methyltransferase [Cryomorpha ignava]
MNKIFISKYKSPFGELIVGSYDNTLCLCDWRYRKMRSAIDNRMKSELKSEFADGCSVVITETIAQLDAYFAGERNEFDLPVHLVGTDFQKQVWNALIQIPFGKTLSYSALSEKLNNPGAIRAVASANGANAISIIVPCHRVIGADGSLTGYAGGLPAKKKLLMLEGAFLTEQMELF